MVQEINLNTSGVRPDISAAEMAEHEASEAARAQAAREGVAEHLDEMGETLLAPEPTATVDWLEILQ